MPDVFIGYGGARAEQVADDLNDFLRSETVDTFCATPKSKQIPEGLTMEQAKQIIRENIEGSAVIVLVCHSDCATPPFVEEINYIIERGLNSKVIIYSKCDDCIPEAGRNLWHPTHFSPEKPEESFPRLLNQIYKKFISLSTAAKIIPAAQGA